MTGSGRRVTREARRLNAIGCWLPRDRRHPGPSAADPDRPEPGLRSLAVRRDLADDDGEAVRVLAGVAHGHWGLAPAYAGAVQRTGSLFATKLHPLNK